VTDILLLDKFFKTLYGAELCIQRTIHIIEIYYVPAFLYYFHFKCMYSKRIILKAPMCSLGIILKDVDSEECKKGCEMCSDITSTGRGDWPFKRCKNP
jgi:hypothetical protein